MNRGGLPPSDPRLPPRRCATGDEPAKEQPAAATVIVPDGASKIAAGAGKGVGSLSRLPYHRPMRIARNPCHRDEIRVDGPYPADGSDVLAGWPADIRSADCGRECAGFDEVALPEVIDPEGLDGIAATRISLADSLSLAVCRSSDLRGWSRLADVSGAGGRAVQEGRANE